MELLKDFVKLLIAIDFTTHYSQSPYLEMKAVMITVTSNFPFVDATNSHTLYLKLALQFY